MTTTSTGSRGTATGAATGGRRPLLQEDVVRSAPARYALAALRIFLGWQFLWPFIDKLFGLGYGTPAERAWIRGGTPAQGFMNNVEGPFAGLFAGMAGVMGPVADWLFMLGLLGIGVALLTGCGVRIMAVSGVALMVFMYLASWPQAGGTNPVTTAHWIEGAGMVVVATTLAGDTLGLGRIWARIINGHGWLR